MYIFGYRFTARYTVIIKANNMEEANEIAEDKYINADFGEAEDIDGKRVKTIDNNDGTYKAVFRFTARYIIEIEEENLEKAKRLAEIYYTDADFGEAEDIDGELKFIEDKKGRRISF